MGAGQGGAPGSKSPPHKEVNRRGGEGVKRGRTLKKQDQGPGIRSGRRKTVMIASGYGDALEKVCRERLSSSVPRRGVKVQREEGRKGDIEGFYLNHRLSRRIGIGRNERSIEAAIPKGGVRMKRDGGETTEKKRAKGNNQKKQETYF